MPRINYVIDQIEKNAIDIRHASGTRDEGVIGETTTIFIIIQNQLLPAGMGCEHLAFGLNRKPVDVNVDVR